jgi:anaerobic selenocysteine-containing dehydrogenase
MSRTKWLSSDGFLRRFSGPLTDLLSRAEVPLLGQVPAGQVPDAVVDTVCGFCSTGCSLRVHMRNGTAVNLSPTEGYPVNLGMACPKGWEALTPLRAPDRGTQPLLRRERHLPLSPTDWEGAIACFVEKARAIQEAHGAGAFAFLGTGQMFTEEMALLGAVFKFGMGFLHGDSNTRQCMATSHFAYKESFGFDAPPFNYEDFEQSDVLIFVGANPCIAHPIMWQRVLLNPHSPWIAVIDPRRTETAAAASAHFAIEPKSDLAFLYGLAHELVRLNAVDSAFVNAHTEGFEEFVAFLQNYSADYAAEVSGIPLERVRELAARIAEGKRVSFWWTMGVNQGYEAVRTAQAIINLALMTGNIGRPGTGANSITGQCNAMGSRLFANTSGLLGGRDFSNGAHRQQVADILGLDTQRIPQDRSMEYDRILSGIEEGKIRGLWVIATNPLHSWIGRGDLGKVLQKLEFLVVQDMYASTETAVHADLFLPAAGWGEKEGTFINSERRIGYAAKVCDPPGEALSDFEIFRRIGMTWGCDDWLERWQTPWRVFEILRELTAGQPCDFSGITAYSQIVKAGGIQWPYRNDGTDEGKHRRLFENGAFYRPGERALFKFEPPRGNPEPADELYPFVLLTGRGSSAEWHTGTRTSKSAVLRLLAPSSNRVEMHPRDAERLGLRQGGRVRVLSRRGSMEARVVLESGVGLGRVFIPMHNGEVNALTLPVFDPYSRQPSYKACAVRLEPIGEHNTAA